MNIQEAEQNIQKLTLALMRAAAEAFTTEVVHRGLEKLVIGEGKEFKTKQDWLDKRIESWLSESARTPTAPVFAPGATVAWNEQGQLRRGKVTGESDDKRCWIVETTDVPTLGANPVNGPLRIDKMICFQA